MKEKKRFSIGIQKSLETLSANTGAFWIYAIVLIVLMGIICLGVFFVAVKGAEEVLVPSITGKDITEALLEMQAKELYPKVVLRYSDSPEDKYKVLEQSPKGGAIVKAGKRINITVSRGAAVSTVEDFVGMTIDDVRLRLSTLFAGTKALIVLGETLYENNSAPAGTVLQQNPAPNTVISDVVTVTLVVSKGPENTKVTVPQMLGASLSDVYAQMQSSSLIFNFSQSDTFAEGRYAEIISQEPAPSSSVNEYSRVETVIAFPENKGINPPVTGIFKYTLLAYSYPMDMELEAIPSSGKPYTIVAFKHLGGDVSVPYSVPKDTVLVLSVLGKEVARIIAR